MKQETITKKQETNNYHKQPVVVVGTGMTTFGELWRESVESLAQTAVAEALNQARMKIEEIDLLVVGNMLLPMLEKRAHVGRVVAEAIGFGGPALAVEAACASGGMAVRQGVMAIRSGMAARVLVVGVEKMSDADGATITKGLMGAGSEEEQWAGATFPALYAMMHREYQALCKLTDHDMAQMAVWSHSQGVHNPLAHFRKAITAEDVIKSAPVADPIRLLHCSPVSDGAAALILSAETRNQKPETSKMSGVEIVGSGVGGDTLSLSKRKSLTSMRATKKALRQAGLMAQGKLGIIDKVEVVEVHDCFSVAGLIALEDLGFCGVGEASTFMSNNRTLSINPSGGLKACGHPVGATGVKQVVAVARELMKGKEWGLTQNVGGTGASAVVHILRNQLPGTRNQKRQERHV
jgi:acetyl-CoA C-acetyltransferase